MVCEGRSKTFMAVNYHHFGNLLFGLVVTDPFGEDMDLSFLPWL